MSINMGDVSGNSSEEDEAAMKICQMFMIIRKAEEEEKILHKLKKCLTGKVNINAQNSKGKTLLHIAVEKRNERIIEYLLKQGAKTDIKNKAGETSLDLAVKTDTLSEFTKYSGCDISNIRKTQRKDKSAVSDLDNFDNTQHMRIPLQYQKCGSSGIEGSLYEVKLLTLILFRGTNKGYLFRLATNMQGAGKFDDVIIEFFDEDTKTKRSLFIQAKHRLDSTEKISLGDLITEKDEDFSLVKYFFSCQELKQNGLIDRHTKVVIFTNLDFEEKVKQLYIIGHTRDEDDILSFKYSTKERNELFDKYYCFKEEIIPMLKEKIENFKPVKIAGKLIDCIIKETTVNLEESVLKDYIYVLAEKVLNINSEGDVIGFRDSFIDKSESLDSKTKRFRQILEDEIQKKSRQFGKVIKEKMQKLKRLYQTDVLVKFKGYFDSKISKNDYKYSLLDLSEYLKCANLKISCSIDDDKVRNNEWPEVPEGEIREFLENHLIFAAKQCDEEQLGEILQKELGQVNIFASDHFQTKVLKWYKEKLKNNMGRVLSNIEGRQFINEIKIKTQSFVYCNKITNFNIQFKDEIIKDLTSFIKQKGVIHLIPEYESILCMVKVYLAVQDSLSEYLFFDADFVFSSLHYILQTIETRDYSGIVVHCKSSDVNKINDLFEDKLNPKYLKSLIIVSDSSNSNEKLNFLSKRDIFKFNDLTKESQQRILSKNVNFQGEIISLNKLLTSENLADILDDKAILTILDNEINIGDKLATLTNHEQGYFIDRSINRQIVIKHEIFDDKEIEDIFAISVKSGKISSPVSLFSARITPFKEAVADKSCIKRFVLLENDQENEQFDILVKANVKNVDMHWLSYRNDKLIWMKSYGSIHNLIRYRAVNHLFSDDTYIQNIMDIDRENKIVVLSATAGMGKTTLLTNVALRVKEIDPLKWVIKISLNEHTSLLSKSISMNRDIATIESAVSFLSKMLEFKKFSQEDRYLENAILKRFLENSGKIELLFDAFDEISPNYTDLVQNLLYYLSKTNITRLWVTTRPNVKEYLEKRLVVFAYNLVPFTSKDQIKFLKSFWKMNFIDDRKRNANDIDKTLDTYSVAILHLIIVSTKSTVKDLIGIPLILMMTAEYFQRSITKYLRDFKDHDNFLAQDGQVKLELPEKLDLVSIYEDFCKKKLLLMGIKQNIDFDKPGMREHFENTYITETLKEYQILALSVLLNSSEFQVIFPDLNVDSVIKGICEKGVQNIGLLDTIHGQPRFFHKTFAEFLAASYLFELLVNNEMEQNFLKVLKIEILSNRYLEILRLFLNGFLANSSRYLSEDVIKETIDDLLTLKDSDKTIFHIAAQEGNLNILMFLLENIDEDSILERIRMKLDGGDRTLQYTAVTNNHLHILEWLIEIKKFDMNLLDRLNHTLLYVSIINKFKEITKYLIKKGVNMNVQSVGYKMGAAHIPKYLKRLDYEKIKRTLNTRLKNMTCLHVATKQCDEEIVTALVENGADVAIKDMDGKTALHTAAEFCDVKMVKYLLDNGCGINDLDEDNSTPLHCAVTRDNDGFEVVRYLINQGADVNAQNYDELTPLHLAADKSKFEELKILVESGAKLDIKDDSNRTCLQIAAGKGDPRIIYFLVENGA